MPNIKVEPTIPNYPPQGIQAQLDLVYLWNPDVANDLIDQINTALEEVGKDLDNYLTKAEAAATYATQTEVTQLSGALEEVSNKVDTVDNDLKELGDQTASIQQDVNTLKTEVPNKVSKTGDTMTGALSFELPGFSPVIRVAKNATIESGPISSTLILRTGTAAWNFATNAMFPNKDNSINLGFDGNHFKSVYTYLLNNGEDITVPTVGGTITLNEANFKTAITDTNKGLTEADAYTKEEVDAKVSSVYRFRGSVATYNDLPTEGNVQGDVWNVEDTGANYAWDGTKWDKLSETIDLTPYLTKEDAASTYATITTVNGKQDALTPDQMAAVNSGITADHVASYDAYAGEISAAQSTADKADGAAEVAQQTANLAGQEAAQALSGLAGKVNIAQGADNAGKVMTVGADGNLAPADAPSSSLPDQTGNAGKFLTTDGTSASWGGAGIDGSRFAYFGSVPEETAAPAGAFCGCNIKTEAFYPIQTYGLGTNINLLSQYCGAVGNDITINGNISCVLGNIINLVTVQSDNTIVITNNGGAQTINEPNALVVGTNGSDFYKLLDGDTGLIPTERLATGGNTGDVLTRTATGAEWSSASSSTVTTDDTLTGTGTADSPLGIAQSVQDSIDGKVSKSGDTMTGTLAFDVPATNPLIKLGVASSIGLGADNIAIRVSVGGKAWSFYTNRLIPSEDNTMSLGNSSFRFTSVNTCRIRNGEDIVVPEKAGTMALLSDIPSAVVASNVFTENLGNNIVRISGTESFGVLAQQGTTEHPITLPVTLVDANYVVQTTATSAGGICEIVSGFSARTTTGFTIGVRNLATAAEATDVAVCWSIIGQKA